MTLYLTDTSIFMRLANTADTLYPIAAQAVLKLHTRGEILHSTSQVFVEFRNVATRPAVVNGLGLDIPTAEAKMARFEAAYPILPETPDIYLAWKALVSKAGVIGKQVHDARLVAVCQVYGISHILTFNVSHFARIAAHVPNLTIVDPANV